MLNARLHYNNWHQKNPFLKSKKAGEITNRKILESLGVKKGKSLLDLGCGKGGFCNFAFNKGLNVYGIDFSEVALKEAKSFNNKINYLLADALALPFKESFFDYAVCIGSLEHFSDKATALKEIHRVLKKNARFFLFLPNSYFIGHIYMVLKTGLPPDEAGQQFSEDFNTKLGWKKLLEDDYFNVVSIQRFNTIWASEKVSGFTKYVYNFILKPFIPFNLSYAFGYLCVKK
jgi:SAM-dependent methyltransferase